LAAIDPGSAMSQGFEGSLLPDMLVFAVLPFRLSKRKSPVLIRQTDQAEFQ